MVAFLNLVSCLIGILGYFSVFTSSPSLLFQTMCMMTWWRVLASHEFSVQHYMSLSYVYITCLLWQQSCSRLLRAQLCTVHIMVQAYVMEAGTHMHSTLLTHLEKKQSVKRSPLCPDMIEIIYCLEPFPLASLLLPFLLCTMRVNCTNI